VSVWAVLAAAGRGERLGSIPDSAAGRSPAARPGPADRPKAFAALRGRPLLAESLERLEASGWIESIVVAAPPEWEEPVILLAEELGCGKVVASVAGGETRGESVRIGVGEVGDDAAVIVVHDAARPLVSDEVIERVVTPLTQGWDGAVPGLPVVDTVKRVASDGGVVETLPRGELVAVQTPQAFVADVLRGAVEGDVAAASDCASLVEARGGRVLVVEGDPRLLKVTTPEDLALVESWLGAEPR
jgi:2-C-methyl-D-erythritol 4-phosphate cytidylyltransferase